MAFLHTGSHECTKSEADLFTIPPTQTMVEASYYVQYKPIASLTDGSTIEFTIPGTAEYIDLAHTMISVRVAIRPTAPIEDPTKVDTSGVGPVNNFLHSMFDSVDVYFNQKPVSPPSKAYAYRSYIENLLNYSPSAKKSHLSSALWYEDTPGKMDDVGTANEGLVKRRKLANPKSIVDMIGPLHCDVFTGQRLLLNGVEVRVRLLQSRDSFCLIDPTGLFTVRILDATLLVRRIRLSPGIALAHVRQLARETAKYPLTRVEVKAVTLHSNIQGESLDNIILGQLPKRLVIGFVDNKSFNGDRSSNPFNFKNYNINFLCVYVDGVQVPSKPLQPDFKKNKLFVDAYHTLFSGTGIHFLNEGNSISREAYADGYCLFAFDLTPDLSANQDSHWNLIRHGSVRIEVRFDDTLSEAVNCIIYAEYDNMLEIDSARQVIIDYSS